MAHRIKHEELLQILICVHCKSQLKAVEQAFLECQGCEAVYPFRKSTPILLRSDNLLFPQSDFVDTDNEKTVEPDSIKRRAGLVSYLPKRSINMCRKAMFARICNATENVYEKILVIGAGTQATSMLNSFKDSSVEFVFCDISKSGDLDLFCDAHELPFSDGVFGGVITTAVMEHVLYPENVADEIVRVLKPNGFVYSEVPFLQAVHEGAYDFTRFSMSGHRRLFEELKELDAGMVAGPGTALVWGIDTFAASLFSNKKLSKLARLTARTTFFWLKYFDIWLANSRVALDGASCTYFYGKKTETPTSVIDIVERYQSVTGLKNSDQ